MVEMDVQNMVHIIVFMLERLTSELTQDLIDQLANGGRLAIPVGEQGGNQFIYVIDKDKNDKIIKRKEL